jgi:hypothetical protein
MLMHGGGQRLLHRASARSSCAGGWQRCYRRLRRQLHADERGLGNYDSCWRRLTAASDAIANTPRLLKMWEWDNAPAAAS